MCVYSNDKFSAGMEVKDINTIIDQLARMHAASYAYMDSYPNGGLEQFKKDNPGFISDKWIPADTPETEQENDNFFLFSMSLVATAVKEYTGDKELTAKLEKFMARCIESTKACITTIEEDFNCLLHNDAWCNNFMFNRYEIVSCLQQAH